MNRKSNYILKLKCSILILILFSGLCISCAEKFFHKKDYTFYDEAFRLDASSPLRTDGVYVLDQIRTDENGGTYKPPKEHRFYTFYKTGQCNLTLDPLNKIKMDVDYINVLQKDSVVKKSTLFEGYFKLEKDKIIIESIVVPRRQFEYKYGYVKKDSLVLIKTGGKGNFEAQYFTSAYKEIYIFKPLSMQNETKPKW